MLLSVVIPLYNEESLIKDLFVRLTQSLDKTSYSYEVIFVDDGSSDNTFAELLSIHRNDKRFKVLSLSRNFGHQAAYTAGLHYAKGEVVVLMDGDLQDPPEIILQMLNEMKSKELDVVFGKRVERKEPFLKKTAILGFHKILSRASHLSIPLNAGNFSVMSREALNAFLELKERNRYLPGLRAFIGFKQGFVNYTRENRNHGKGKMSFRKLYHLAMDALFSFSKLPIRICIILGIIGIIGSVTGGIFVLIAKYRGEAILGWTSTLLSIFLFGSVQLFFMGVMGEYIHRIFVEIQGRPLFIVRKYYDE